MHERPDGQCDAPVGIDHGCGSVLKEVEPESGRHRPREAECILLAHDVTSPHRQLKPEHCESVDSPLFSGLPPIPLIVIGDSSDIETYEIGVHVA